MPTLEPEPAQIELSTVEATSKIAAKIYLQQNQDLTRQIDSLQRELQELRPRLEKEKGLRIKYETHYSATYAPLIILTVICSLVAGAIFVATSDGMRIFLVAIFVACIIVIIWLCSFRPSGE